jgi:PAS domain S-box-containing protein
MSPKQDKMDKVTMEKEFVNILIVDDKASNLVALESFLRSDEYNLVTATSGALALEYLLKIKDFALILTDVMMPCMDGFQLVEQVKKFDELKDIPVIFLTAMSSEMDDILRGYEVGGVDYLQKPLVPEVVKAKVNVFAELFRQKQLIKKQAQALRDSERKQEEQRIAEIKRMAWIERQQTIKDIAERKHSEERLKVLNEELERRVEERTADVRRTERQLRLIADAMPIIVLEIDKDQKCSFINNAGQEWLLAGTGNVVGRSLRELVGDERYARIKPYVNSVLTGRQVTSEWVMTRDKIHVLNVNYIPEFDQLGRVNGFLLVATDITKHKEAEDELKRAKKSADDASAAKSEFLANMSHEIRTPLGVVLGFSELLSSDQLPGTVREEYVEAIKRNGDLLSTIISDILDLSKVEAGKVEIEAEDVMILDILNDISTILGPQAEEKGLQLIVEAEESIPKTIKTDALRLRQVLINIVGNAVKFTEAGEVRVYAKYVTQKQGKGQISISVSDTGPGIGEEKVNKLFKLFTQADASTKRKYGGTGLGLVLAKKLAHLLGGDVVLSSSEVGKGSVFTITIDTGIVPQQKVEREGATKAVPMIGTKTESNQHTRLDGVKILLVEDGLDNRVLVGRILSVAGAEVDTASNGKEALDKVNDKNYDILLMDLQMPVMDGYEATSTLRQGGYSKPIIALTAHALKEERQRCLVSGFDDHVRKPIDRSALINCIAHHSQKHDEVNQEAK